MGIMAFGAALVFQDRLVRMFGIQGPIDQIGVAGLAQRRRIAHGQRGTRPSAMNAVTKRAVLGHGLMNGPGRRGEAFSNVIMASQAESVARRPQQGLIRGVMQFMTGQASIIIHKTMGA